MHRDTSLPAEFAPLSGQVSFVQRKSSNEYSSSCPQCGGSVHSDGEYPDRFIMLLRSTATGGAFGFCRICNYKWWSDKGGSKGIDPETLRLLEQQAEGYRQKQAAKRANKLAQFTTQEWWEELHSRLQAEQREWWRLAGVPDDWQDYLHLGYTPDKAYLGKDGELRHSPAYTIPYFHSNFAFITLQYA